MQNDYHLNYMIERVQKPILGSHKIHDLIELKYYCHSTYCILKCNCNNLPLKQIDKLLLNRLMVEHDTIYKMREFSQYLYSSPERSDEDLDSSEIEQELINRVCSLSNLCGYQEDIKHPQSMRILLDYLDNRIRKLRVRIDESFVKIHSSDLKSNNVENGGIINLKLPTQNITTISPTVIPPTQLGIELIVDQKDNKVSKGEHELKQVLESIFPGKIFAKIRHNSIKNPETGRSLEIDCYNDELKIGGEYNGEQHIKRVTKFHKTRKSFDDQMKRDIYKQVCAKQLGITLVVINYNCNNMKAEVISQLIKAGKLLK